MPVPVPVPAGNNKRRRLASYPQFAAISQGSRTRKYREIFEAAAKPQLSRPANPLLNENLIIVDSDMKRGLQLIPEAERPRPNTVRNIRLMFEPLPSAEPSLNCAQTTKFRSLDRFTYNRNALEKVLLHGRLAHPRLTVGGGAPEPDASSTISSKSFVFAVGGAPPMRWPSLKDRGSRTASTCSTGSSRWWSRSTDAESSVSETSDWSHSDWDSDSAWHRDSLFDNDVEGSYVSPEVMERIRARGRSYKFVDGRMIDDRGLEIEHPDPSKPPSRTDDLFSSSGMSSADEDSRSSSPPTPRIRKIFPGTGSGTSSSRHCGISVQFVTTIQNS